ncbi:MAG: hypothetical protein M3Y51_09515 [Actinomycetota bacterium]|nr:hypothetical protein [Actinomycetota bacterium]
MSTTDIHHVPDGPSAALWDHQRMQRWLAERRNAGVRPDAVASELIATGWDADAAARLALRSLRSSDRQTLTYAALNLAAGFAALGAASSAHLIIDGNPDPTLLTCMLTMWLIATPIAIVVWCAARRIESRSSFVMWSGSRRGWYGALAFCTGLVGIGRLLNYVFHAIATLTGASSGDFTVAAAMQVALSLAVSIPMFLWSFREWRRSNLVIAALSVDTAADRADAGR